MIAKLNILILDARKEGNKFKIKCLSLVKSELVKNTKAKKPIADMDIILGHLKQLKKSLPMFKDTTMEDDLKNEIEIVEGLTPKKMSDEAIENSVKEYFNLCSETVKPGIAIKNLKDSYGAHNGAVIVKYVMIHANRTN